MKKLLLEKILRIGLIATTIGLYPSMSHERALIPESTIYEITYVQEKDPSRVTEQELVKKITTENLNTGKYSPNQAVELLKKSVAKEGGLPEPVDIGAFYCFVKNESGWDPNARSKSGARGLGQIMRRTWKEHNPGTNYNKAYEPEANLETAVKIINSNEEYFKEKHPNWKNISKEEKLKIHAAAYNWGNSRVKRIDWDLNKEKRIPKETRNHVKRIMKDYFALSKEEI